MKKSTISLFTNISNSEMGNLTKEVKETLVSNQPCPNGKSFTAAEMWAIQRQVRTRTSRRFL